METATKRGTSFPDIFLALAEEFAPEEHKCLKKGGQELWYITARSVMNRLDTVLGPENWADHYVVGANSVLCQLTITLPDGRTLTKEDAGAFAGMKDLGDNDKSGLSDAFKRAAVKFGVGRYLYRDGTPDFGGEVPNEAPLQANGRPPVPAELEPLRHSAVHAAAKLPDDEPITHSDVVTWCLDQHDRTGKDFKKWLEQWGLKRGYPGWLTKWSADQLREGFYAAVARLEKFEAQSPEALSN